MYWQAYKGLARRPSISQIKSCVTQSIYLRQAGSNLPTSQRRSLNIRKYFKIESIQGQETRKSPLEKGSIEFYISQKSSKCSTSETLRRRPFVVRRARGTRDEGVKPALQDALLQPVEASISKNLPRRPFVVRRVRGTENEGVKPTFKAALVQPKESPKSQNLISNQKPKPLRRKPLIRKHRSLKGRESVDPDLQNPDFRAKPYLVPCEPLIDSESTSPQGKRAFVVRKYHVSKPGHEEILQPEETSMPSEPSKKISKPLRILFCGSDDFSSGSLRALHDELKRGSGLIASIDVLCRPGKRSGRSLKSIREVPIKAVAAELGLPLHERDTFTGWDLPRSNDEPINLIIAVSFGLFVPPRILKSAEYGGLNVHPSLLPNFRGPAPLQYTILTGSDHCGVTLQTLDAKTFDNGTILAQTNKLSIPQGDKCTYFDLLNYITPIAAEVLVRGLKQGVFVPPQIDAGWINKLSDKEALNLKTFVHARKITSDDRWINWRQVSPIRIEARHRALGRLWCEVMLDPHTKKRMVFEDMELVEPSEDIKYFFEVAKKDKQRMNEIGEKANIRFVYMIPTEETIHMRRHYFVYDGDGIIMCSKKGALRIKQITVEGKAKQDARKVFEGVKQVRMTHTEGWFADFLREEKRAAGEGAKRLTHQ